MNVKSGRKTFLLSYAKKKINNQISLFVYTNIFGLRIAILFLKNYYNITLQHNSRAQRAEESNRVQYT